jgi:hypothetical protein
MEKINTVRIVASDPETQGFYVIINEDDFDKKTMKVYDGPENPVAEVAKSFEELAAELAETKAKLAALSPPVEGGEGWNNPPA